MQLRPLSIPADMKALALFLALPIAALAAAPLNCAKAATPTERTICSTPTLLQADARMTAYFEIATQLVPMGSRGNLYDSQHAFPVEREKCGTNKTCILATYKKQTEPLERIIQRVREHGPF